MNLKRAIALKQGKRTNTELFIYTAAASLVAGIFLHFLTPYISFDYGIALRYIISIIVAVVIGWLFKDYVQSYEKISRYDLIAFSKRKQDYYQFRTEETRKKTFDKFQISLNLASLIFFLLIPQAQLSIQTPIIQSIIQLTFNSTPIFAALLYGYEFYSKKEILEDLHQELRKETAVEEKRLETVKSLREAIEKDKLKDATNYKTTDMAVIEAILRKHSSTAAVATEEPNDSARKVVLAIGAPEASPSVPANATPTDSAIKAETMVPITAPTGPNPPSSNDR
ncbi:hypothetical protein [Pseudomonas sp. BF-R-26]|uniref:hypothetical protein n=1 Tax=Pseudomonas sp. BF-R-26 TaxID=2832398 RepID=UPI001CBF5992|nr:hypothetical protein [Pseudomonas sp. BF-R-26]